MKNAALFFVATFVSLALVSNAKAFGVKEVLNCSQKGVGTDSGLVTKILVNPEKGLIADLSRQTISGPRAVGQWAVVKSGTDDAPSYKNENAMNPFSLNLVAGSFTADGQEAKLQYGLAAAIYTVYCK